MDPIDVPDLGRMRTEEFDRFIRDFDKGIINNICIKGAKYRRLRSVIIDLMRMIKRVYITLSEETMSGDELVKFNDETDRNFSSALTSFLKFRSALIENLTSQANKLDRTSSLTATVRLLGFTVEGINSLFAGGNLLESFLNASPFLKLSIRCLSLLASFLGVSCLITSFYGCSSSKYVNFCAINLIEEDKELSESVNNLFLQKDAIVKELFSLDEEVIKDVDETSYLTDTEKIFATLLISGMKKNPFCIKDKKFLCQVYLFSRTNTAKIWYKRELYRIHHEDEPINLKIPEDDIFQLKMMPSETNQSEEILIFLLKSLNLPRFVLFGLCTVFFSYEIQKFRCGNKCRPSNNLKELALHYTKINRTLRKDICRPIMHKIT